MQKPTKNVIVKPVTGFKEVYDDTVPLCPTCKRPLRPMTSTERSRKSRKQE